MSVYSAYRDWVDSVIHENAIRAPAPILLVAILPLALLLFFDKRPILLVSAVFAWAALVVAWGCWRYWRHAKAEAVRSDEKFDREGKYRLSKEYHSTVSATKAKEAKNG